MGAPSQSSSLNYAPMSSPTVMLSLITLTSLPSMTVTSMWRSVLLSRQSSTSTSMSTRVMTGLLFRLAMWMKSRTTLMLAMLGLWRLAGICLNSPCTRSSLQSIASLFICKMKQQVYFQGNDELQDVLDHPSARKTHLTGWFKANQQYPDTASQHLYQDFPQHFV